MGASRETHGSSGMRRMWTAFVAGAMVATSALALAPSSPAQAARTTAGLVALYEFGEGSGTTVADTSGVGAALDLTIADAGAVAWNSNGLAVTSSTTISSSGAATKVNNAVTATNEVSIEAWVAPADTTATGPARIASLSANTSNRNITLGQLADAYQVRLRSTTTSSNGEPSVSSSAGSLTTDLTHVVYTRDAAGVATIYVDGDVAGSGTVGGDLSSWDSTYAFLLANEVTGDRPWLGQLCLVAIYDSALSAADVDANLAAGCGTDIVDPPAGEVPVASGLVLELQADAGLSSDGTGASTWEDQSASGNDLVRVAGDPQVAPGATPTGEPAVVFDGNDSLERNGSITGLPTGSDDRTMFLVAKYDAVTAYSGAAFGNGATNQAFGLVAATDQQKNLAVQGFGGANDLVSATPGVGAGWMVQSAVVQSNAVTHYKDGGLIGNGTRTYNTGSARIALAREINYLGFGDMDIAAVLVYDRALNSTEAAQVEAYLQAKYVGGGTPGGNTAPVAGSDAVVIDAGDSVTIDVLANDTDDSALDPASVTVVSSPTNGTIDSIDATTGEITYTHDGSVDGDSFTYTVDDDEGAVSNVAVVAISLAGSELPLTGFSDEQVLTGINQPTGIAWLPDGRMLVLQKDGTIFIADADTGNKNTYMTIPSTAINTGTERGLLDIVLDPNFASNGYFYLYYTQASPERAAIMRFSHVEGGGGLSSTGNFASLTKIWEDTDGYVSCCHYGGGLDFGPDGKLWLSTSDKFTAPNPGEGGPDTNYPVNLASASGKVIRVNTDGSVPDGTDGWPANPYADGPGGNHDYIWDFGLRNPFRAEWDFIYGKFYMGEVGGNQASLSEEDLHYAALDLPATNHGWPYCEGTSGTSVNSTTPCSPAHRPPIFSYPRNSGSSITGGEVYRGSMFPAEWQGVYFYGDYTRDFIRYLTLDSTGSAVTGDYAFKPSGALPGNTNAVTYIGVGSDGALYYSLYSSDQIRRIVHSGANLAPKIDTISVTPLTGTAPLLVDLNATVSDADSASLTYTWTFGDGTTPESGPVPPGGVVDTTHSFSADGAFNAYLQVSDGDKSVLSQVFVIQVGDTNAAPTITSTNADVSLGEAPLDVSFTGVADDADGDDLTYTWTFGDGSEASGDVGLGGAADESHTYTADGNYNAVLEVSDGTNSVLSEPITIQVGDAVQVPVTSGLVLLLESDTKVGLAGSDVLDWLDGAGDANSLSATGNPQIVEGATPSGKPGIYFDGIDDSLVRTEPDEAITNLPSGSSDRTLFMVVDYVDANGVFSGFSYGNGAANQAFGLVTNGNNGNLAVQGWGSGNDFPSTTAGQGAGWLSQSVVLQDDAIRQFLDGAQIDTDPHTFATNVQKMVIGAEISELGFSEMGIAAVLMYDRALTEPEREQVEAYIQNKYFNTAPTVTITNPIDGAQFTEGDAVQFEATASDPDDGDLSGSIEWTSDIDGPLGSGASIAASGLSVGTHTITAAVEDSDTNIGDDSVEVVVEADGGGTPTQVPVTDGLRLLLESDNNVALAGGTTVSGWLDGSGDGNDMTAGGDPQVVDGATPSGAPAISFDGTDDQLVRNGSLNNMPVGNDDRTVFTVTKYDSAEWGGFAWGDAGTCNEVFGTIVNGGGELTVQGWCSDFPSGVAGTGAGWLIQSVVHEAGVFTHYKDDQQIDTDSHVFNTGSGAIVLGSEIDSNPFVDMETAAVLVYDRALDAGEYQQVYDYLYSKYFEATDPPEVTITSPTTGLVVTEGTSIDFAATVTDTDDDDATLTAALDWSSNLAPNFGTGGSFSDVLPVGTHTVTASVTDSDGDVGSDTIEVIVEADDPGTPGCGAPVVGATPVLCLESGVGIAESGGVVDGWADQSAQGNNLASAGTARPALVAASTPSGAAAVSFDGVDDLLDRVNTVDPITGLPAGSADRSMFVVARYNSILSGAGWGGASYGTGAAGQAFGLGVPASGGAAGQLMVQRYASDYISGDAGVGEGWLVQSAVLDAGALEHFRDGEPIDTRATTSFNTVVNRLVLGDEIASSGHQHIDLAAVLIFDGALDATDRAAVEAYLADTYMVPADNEAPAAPADVAAVGGDAVVDVTWSANGEPDLDEYRVYRSETSDSIDPTVDVPLTVVAAGGSTAFADDTVVNGSTYFYVVTAVDASGNQSVGSVEVSATPDVGTPDPNCAVPAVSVQVVLCLESDAGVTRSGRSGFGLGRPGRRGQRPDVGGRSDDRLRDDPVGSGRNLVGRNGRLVGSRELDRSDHRSPDRWR